MEFNTVTTISTVTNESFHLTLRLTDTSPLPLIFDTIGEDDIEGFEIFTTVEGIS